MHAFSLFQHDFISRRSSRHTTSEHWISKVTAEGEDPVAVPYRYVIAAARSGKCNVFKPNPLAEDAVLRSGAVIFCNRVHQIGINCSSVLHVLGGMRTLELPGTER